MKRLVLASAMASSIAVTGCATDPIAATMTLLQQDSQGQRVQRPARRSAARPARLSARWFRASARSTGAVVGAVLGGVAGAVIKGQQYYRDTRGYCYYVDQYGNPIYDYNVRC